MKRSRMPMAVAIAIACLYCTQLMADELEPQLVARFSSFMGFKLESGATLADVRSKVGQAPVNQRGDGGEYEASICYRTKAGVLAFLSGEMGGKELDLLGFSVSREPGPRDLHCVTLDKAPPLVIGGLRLGMSRQDFTSAVGGKVEWQGSTAQRGIDSREPLRKDLLEENRKAVPTAQTYYDVSMFLKARFQGENLVAYEIWMTKTY